MIIHIIIIRIKAFGHASVSLKGRGKWCARAGCEPCRLKTVYEFTTCVWACEGKTSQGVRIVQ